MPHLWSVHSRVPCQGSPSTGKRQRDNKGQGFTTACIFSPASSCCCPMVSQALLNYQVLPEDPRSSPGGYLLASPLDSLSWKEPQTSLQAFTEIPPTQKSQPRPPSSPSSSQPIASFLSALPSSNRLSPLFVLPWPPQLECSTAIFTLLVVFLCL